MAGNFNGAARHLRRLRSMGPRVEREASRLVYALADMHAAEAARLITTGGAFGRNHVVSQPGEPPNSDTGTLDRSVHVEPAGTLQAKSVADAPYAAALEFGTSKMAERPFMRPAAKTVKEDVDRLAREAMRRIRDGGTL